MLWGCPGGGVIVGDGLIGKPTVLAMKIPTLIDRVSGTAPWPNWQTYCARHEDPNINR
jgi:hypothetical protein